MTIKFYFFFNNPFLDIILSFMPDILSVISNLPLNFMKYIAVNIKITALKELPNNNHKSFEIIPNKNSN